MRSALAGLLLMLALQPAACNRSPAAKVGDPAPDFTLPRTEGGDATLSDYRGTYVLLLFWTQGCVFCQTRNIVAVNDIYRKGRQTGLTVLSVNIAEPKGDAQRFARQMGLVFPVLLDKDAAVTRKKYGVYLVPTVFIVDPEGVIADKAYGHLSEARLWEFVDPYLKPAE